MTTQTNETKIINGVNLNQLGQTVQAVQDDPKLAKFKFKCKNK